VRRTAKPVLYGDVVRWGLIQADALLMLARLPENCVDAIVTDPPYGIEIKGEGWDGAAIRRAVRRHGEALPTSEALERWTAVWAAEARRVLKPGGHLLAFGAPRTFHRLVAGVEDAGLQVRDQLLWMFSQGVPKSRRMSGGYGTGLKPCFEPILLARAPFPGTTQRNLAEWGTGALNIDAARVGEAGHWPANLTLSHAFGCTEARCMKGCPAELLDRARPDLLPSRLFFCAKASRHEREAGCEQLPERSVQLFTGPNRSPRMRRNTHPTVKPLELMRWLVRLVTPPGGLVLDPFTGSGTTGIAAVMEDRMFLGLEREAAYVDIACARLTHWAAIAAQEEVLP
jgi:site-specific DNA-methyltransferase (adenine-specific)